MLIDLHCHTAERSDDSRIPLRELAEAARVAGLDGIAVTDHDAFWPASELDRVSQEVGILILPGAEINTDAGHAIVFGLSEYRFGMHRPEYLHRAVRIAGGAMLAAHPYRRALPPGVEAGGAHYGEAVDRALRNPLFSHVSAIETANGRGSDSQNRFSSDVAVRLGLPAVGVSDAHDADDLGKAATEFFRPIRTLTDLIVELWAGRFRPVSPVLNGRTG